MRTRMNPTTTDTQAEPPKIPAFARVRAALNEIERDMIAMRDESDKLHVMVAETAMRANAQIQELMAEKKQLEAKIAALTIDAEDDGR